MSMATLLVHPGEENPDSPRHNVFSFEHAMAHRGLMAVMAPLTQWSIMPYYIDPTNFGARAATKWPFNHQQAHNDLTDYLPAYSTAPTAGIPTNKNLVDVRIDDPGSRAWWTHNNHQEHLIAANAIFPLPLTEPPPTYWWALDPRLAQTYW